MVPVIRLSGSQPASPGPGAKPAALRTASQSTSTPASLSDLRFSLGSPQPRPAARSRMRSQSDASGYTMSSYCSTDGDPVPPLASLSSKGSGTTPCELPAYRARSSLAQPATVPIAAGRGEAGDLATLQQLVRVMAAALHSGQALAPDQDARLQRVLASLPEP